MPTCLEERRFTSELQKWAEQQQEAEMGEGHAMHWRCVEGLCLGETGGICIVLEGFSYSLLCHLPNPSDVLTAAITG